MKRPTFLPIERYNNPHLSQPWQTLNLKLATDAPVRKTLTAYSSSSLSNHPFLSHISFEHLSGTLLVYTRSSSSEGNSVPLASRHTLASFQVSPNLLLPFVVRLRLRCPLKLATSNKRNLKRIGQRVCLLHRGPWPSICFIQDIQTQESGFAN